MVDMSALCEVWIRIISQHLVFDIGSISIKRSAEMVTMIERGYGWGSLYGCHSDELSC